MARHAAAGGRGRGRPGRGRGPGLRREGYAVDVAYDGDEALDTLAVTDYDLVCLDLNLPDIDGLEVCRRIRRRLRARTEPPRVLMLTARDGVDDRVAGLDDGADDYLVKPFAFAELLGPGAHRCCAATPAAPARCSQVGRARARHRPPRGVRGATGRLDLTAKEFALLRYFMTHPGEVLSQEHLLEHVWDEYADPFTNTVRVTVGTLRRKLAEEARRR